MLNKPIDYPTDQLFKQFKVFNIRQIYLNVLLKFMHKNLNSFKQYSHNYSTKGLDTFRLFELNVLQPLHLTIAASLVPDYITNLLQNTHIQ